MRVDYIPHDDDGQKDWLQNYADEIEAIAAALALDPAKATEAKNKCNSLVGKIDMAKQKKAELKTATDDKKVTRTSVLGDVRLYTAALKTNTNFTTAQANTLRVKGGDTFIDLNTITVDFTLKLIGNSRVEIDFNKPGGIDGVNVYARLKGGNGNWTFLGLDNYTPYVDTRPITSATAPEEREYALRPVIHDEEVGVLSGIKGIVVV
ncbi:MAG: hypothetical protein NTX03_00575 [Bacteroidetes bacterium]|nr:hypothetical protein [Bacteroidota bacterium]